MTGSPITSIPQDKKKEQERIARDTAAFLDQGKVVEILTPAPNHEQTGTRRPSIHSNRFNPGNN